MADVIPPVSLPSELSCLSQLVEEKPQGFITGNEEIRAAAKAAAKYVFDLSLKDENIARSSVADFIRSIRPATERQTRSKTRQASKQKSPPPQKDEEIWKPTPLESLFLEGMDDDQVWAQLELRNGPLCDVLKMVIVGEEVSSDEEGSMDDSEAELEDEEDSDEGYLDNMNTDDYEDEDEEEMEEDDDDDDDDASSILEEATTHLRDPSSEEELDEESENGADDIMDLDRPTRPFSKKQKAGTARHPVLDDGFFSLADFNAETEEAEARGVSKGHLAADDDDDEEIENDVDLFASVDVDANTFEEEDLEGEAYYKDFFAPPPPKARSVKLTVKEPPPKKPKSTKVHFDNEVKVKTIKSRGKGISLKALAEISSEDFDVHDIDGEWDEALEADEGEYIPDSEGDSDDDNDEEDEEDMGEGEEDESEPLNDRETMERFKDDLFAEDDDNTLKDDLSSFEKRQAEIAAQMAELESKNVAPKEWMLMGEATSRSRPVNSLLEQDLEFERVTKPAPLITEDAVETLEALIKSRILDNKFDDVVRKVVVEDKPFLPSRYFELNEKKSEKSLAEIYEAEYTAATSGGTTDDRDGKLKKEHDELEAMWNSISYKLDALTNAHFTPKPPKASISTISNVPATTMESALPTTSTATTMLAPEEIFSASKDIRSRDELTPNEKRTQRNKQKKLRKKMKDRLDIATNKMSSTRSAKGAGTIKREKAKAMKDVVKAGKGVTVIGKESAQSKRQAKEGQGAGTIDAKKLKL